ncbi:Uncharacterised protein g5055 [Pycnogonum litorale]
MESACKKYICSLILVMVTSILKAEFDCESNRISFEKIIGHKLLRRQHRATVEMVSQNETSSYSCNELCKNDASCTAYSIDFKNKECHVTTERSLPDHSSTTSTNASGHFNTEHFYFRKICLKGAVCKKDWSFTVIPGVKRIELKSETERVIRNVLIGSECREYCFAETRYNCRSAIYFPSTRICVLNSKSIRSSTDEYDQKASYVATDEDYGIYMDNACVREPKKCEFQKKFLREDFWYSDKIIKNISRRKCSEYCLLETAFLCDGFVHEEEEGICRLTSRYLQKDVIDGPSPTHQRLVRVRGKCTDVVMKCDATTMTAVITVESSFRGRIYAMSHPYGCFSIPSYSRQDEIFLTMPLWGQQCGTKDLANGTFSNSIIIQEHPNILRQTDKRIDIYCDYDVIRQKLRSGKQVLEGNDISELPAVITGVVPTPNIRLQIINDTGHEVTGVKLGQNLKLKVEISDESVFGIFGSGLVARSGDNEDYIPLIDEKGCPIEPSVFPALYTKGIKRTLIAPFQAFKFASDSVVKFDLTVSFCLDKCPPVDCGPNNSSDEKIKSFGRRKRSTKPTEEYNSGDIVTDVRMQRTLVVISNLKPTQERKDGHHHESESDALPGNKTDNVSIPSSPGLCVTRSMMYVFIAVVALFQIFMMTGCILCIFHHKSSAAPSTNLSTSSSSSRSHDSVSSRTKLFAQSSLTGHNWT